MADSDDPCDGIVGDNLAGWLKRDSSRSSEKDSRQRLEGSKGSGYLNSWTRFEHG